MFRNNVILLGKSEDVEVSLIPSLMNRHGLIAGASGTGKTVTLKVLAESLSQAGVPTFIADVKGDLSGMIQVGDQSAIQERLDSMGIKDFQTRNFPVRFFDVYREHGLPIRAVIQDMSPILFAQILGLSDTQQGVLQIIFKVASDMELDIIDLKDMQAMTQYVSEHASEISGKYGNVSKQSVGTIQRRLLELEQQGGASLFGMPGLDVNDLIQCQGQEGYMNILECSKLFHHPMLYSTLLLWILDLLDLELPEVGDLDKPKIVFFFDEAHVLFDNASAELQDKIQQIVKLIRSKGVGIFFCTQSPNDIPDEVLGQLSNKIQHALRAYTPAETKAVKTAADSFRPNPKFKTEDVITSMKTGHALVSVLDADGAPTIVQETKIFPPMSSMKAASEAEIAATIQKDSFYSKYMNDVDPESAFEKMDEVKANEDEQKELNKTQQLEAKLAEKKALAKQKEEIKKEQAVSKETGRIVRKIQNRAENELINMGIRSAKNILKGFLK